MLQASAGVVDKEDANGFLIAAALGVADFDAAAAKVVGSRARGMVERLISKKKKKLGAIPKLELATKEAVRAATAKAQKDPELAEGLESKVAKLNSDELAAISELRQRGVPGLLVGLPVSRKRQAVAVAVAQAEPSPPWAEARVALNAAYAAHAAAIAVADAAFDHVEKLNRKVEQTIARAYDLDLKPLASLAGRSLRWREDFWRTLDARDAAVGEAELAYDRACLAIERADLEVDRTEVALEKWWGPRPPHLKLA